MTAFIWTLALAAYGQETATTCMNAGWSNGASTPICWYTMTTYEAECDGTASPPATEVSSITLPASSSLWSPPCLWDANANTVTNTYCEFNNLPTGIAFPNCAIDCVQAEGELEELGDLSFYPIKLGSIVEEIVASPCDEQLSHKATFDEMMNLLQAQIGELQDLDQLYGGACPALTTARDDATEVASNSKAVFHDAYCYDTCEGFVNEQEATATEAQGLVDSAQAMLSDPAFCDDVLTGFNNLNALQEQHTSAVNDLAINLDAAQIATCDGLLDPNPEVPAFEIAYPECACLEPALDWLNAASEFAVLDAWLDVDPSQWDYALLPRTLCSDVTTLEAATQDAMTAVEELIQCGQSTTEIASTFTSIGAYLEFCVSSL